MPIPTLPEPAGTRVRSMPLLVDILGFPVAGLRIKVPLVPLTTNGFVVVEVSKVRFVDIVNVGGLAPSAAEVRTSEPVDDTPVLLRRISFPPCRMTNGD